MLRIILTALIVLILSHVFWQYRRRTIALSAAVLWGLLWIAGAVLVLWPDLSSRVASAVGVGRGVDLVVYVAILALFYLLFRIIVRIERIERSITDIVRKDALVASRSENAEALSRHSEVTEVKGSQSERGSSLGLE